MHNAYDSLLSLKETQYLNTIASSKQPIRYSIAEAQPKVNGKPLELKYVERLIELGMLVKILEQDQFKLLVTLEGKLELLNNLGAVNINPENLETRKSLIMQ